MTDNTNDDNLLDAAIPEAIRHAFLDAQQQARVPPAEFVWLRAAMRAREEAARKAMRPIVVGQAVGIAVFAGLLVSLLGRLPISSFLQLPFTLIAVVIGSWLVLAPVALYLALSRD
jgi:hypothetical protein